jgi:hypothetical protein
MKWQWSIDSPFGPLIKWPNLHYPGVDEMSGITKLFKVTFSNGKEPEMVRTEGLRMVLRDLEPGEHVDIERLEDAKLQ